VVGAAAEIHDLYAKPGRHAVGLGHGEIDAVLHAGAFRQHRALHRPGRVEAQLALGALTLGCDVAAGDAQSEQHDGDRGDSRQSHGASSVLGAMIEPLGRDGRYETMAARSLSTVAPGAREMDRRGW